MYQGAGLRQLPQMRPTSQVPSLVTPGKEALFLSFYVVKSSVPGSVMSAR